MILDFINTIISFIQVLDKGKIKIEFYDTDIQFFKPLAGYAHWSEENYKKEPLSYRIVCKIHVHNGKKQTIGLKKCSIVLNECPSLDMEESKAIIDFSAFLNIPPGESREIVVVQEKMLFYADKLKDGYSVSFKYEETGKDKQHELVIYRRKG